MRNVLSRWVPVLLWGSLIYFGTEVSDPKSYLPTWLLQWTDQIIFGEYRLTRILGLITHFVEFFILFLLLARALMGRGKLEFWRLLTAVDLALLYAVLDEVHQIYIPERLFELKDLAVDGAGVVLGLAVYLLWQVTGFKPRQKRGEIETTDSIL